jgi:hypothetical protein
MKKSNKKVMIVGGVLLLGVIVFSIYQVGGITQKKRDEKRRGDVTPHGLPHGLPPFDPKKSGKWKDGGYGADTILPDGQVLNSEDTLKSLKLFKNEASPYNRGVTWAQKDN